MCAYTINDSFGRVTFNPRCLVRNSAKVQGTGLERSSKRWISWFQCFTRNSLRLNASKGNTLDRLGAWWGGVVENNWIHDDQALSLHNGFLPGNLKNKNRIGCGEEHSRIFLIEGRSSMYWSNSWNGRNYSVTTPRLILLAVSMFDSQAAGVTTQVNKMLICLPTS